MIVQEQSLEVSERVERGDLRGPWSEVVGRSVARGFGIKLRWD